MVEKIQKCKLCKTKEADKRGSHMVPFLLMKFIDNEEGSLKRDKELGFIISESLSKPYIGQSILPEKIEKIFGELSDEEIIQMSSRPNVVDFVFCRDCEVRFSLIESQFSQIINKADSFFEQTNREGICLVKDSTKVSLIFWLSVFWRYSLSNDKLILTTNEMETIRRILDKHTPNTPDISIENIPEDDKDLSKIKFKVIYCPGYSTEFAGFLNVDFNFSKPRIMIIGDFIIQLHVRGRFDQLLSMNFYNFNKILLKAPELSISTSDKYLIIEKGLFNKFVNVVLKEFTQSRFEKIIRNLDEIHKKLGGVGKEMPLEIKNEIIMKLGEGNEKLGKEFSIEHQAKVISEVLEKYTAK